MLHRLYAWTLAKAAHRHAERWLILFSFLESSVFPIPPHPLLGLMCLARPKHALRYGIVCTLASVAGGVLGYGVGYFLFEAVGQSLLAALHLAASFPKAACYLRDYGAQIILLKGATPIPFKLITLTAGFVHLPLTTFLWASLLSRGFQFVLVGALFWRFGAPIRATIEQYLLPMTIAFVALAAGGVLAAGMLAGGPAASDRCARATMDSFTR